MLVVAIHMPLSPSSPHTPEPNVFTPTEKNGVDNQSNPTNPLLISDKDIALGSLLTARCCFGTASINDMIYVVGMY